MRGDDGSGNELPVRVERAILAILERPGRGTEHTDEIRRDLRALFLRLAPKEANAVVRRLDGGSDDVLATSLRRVIQPRR